MLILKLAIRNLKSSYKKNLIALISIVAGFVSINLFEGYMKGAQELFAESYEERLFYGDFTITHENAFKDTIFFDGINYISKKDQDKLLSELMKNEEIETPPVRRLRFKGMMTNGGISTQVIGEGIDVDAAEMMRGKKWKWNTNSGHPLTSGNPDTNDAIVGEELGNLLNCKTIKNLKFLNPAGGYIPNFREMDCPRHEMQLNSTTDAGQANAIFLNVVGTSNFLYRELDSRFIQTSLVSAQRLLDTQGVSIITIRINQKADKERFLIKVQNFIHENNLPLVITTWKNNAFGDIYRQSMSFLNVLRGFFLIVILMIVLFSVIATQNRLVFERIKETATLRSLGFKKSLITKIFLCEALILAFMGIILGSLFSILVSFMVRKIGIFYLIGILSEQVPFIFSLSILIFLKSGVVLTLISLFACYLPLRRAMSLSINEAFSKT